MGYLLPLEQLQAYKLSLDPSELSMSEYLETQMIEDEAGQLVPMKLRPFQKDLVDLVEAKWKSGHAFYGIVIKAGQLGYSSLIESMLAEGISRVPGCKALTVAHDVDSTTDLFGKVQFAVDQTPDEAYDFAGKVRQNSSGHRIRFRHYDPVHRDPNSYRVSQCRVMTARKRQGARSATVNRMHLSEYAHWEDPSRIDAFQRCVHDVAGNFLIVETTALGRNAAYDIWNDALAGRGDWVPVFTAWWEHARYTTPFKSQKERDEFIASIGKSEPWRYGGKEEIDLYLGKIGYVLRGKVFGFKPLTAEQLHWRRKWIDNKCRGALGLFHQEMPSFPEEAFQFSGLPVYDTAKLKSWERVAHRMEPKHRRVRLEWDKDLLELGNLASCPVRAIDDPLGWLTILEMPEVGAKCVGGIDVAEGLEPIKGKGDTDYTAGYVKDWSTGTRYARYHARTEPEDAAEHWFLVSRFFGDAWLLPEANGPGLALIKLMEKMGFQKLINRPRTERTAEGDGTIEMRPGFKTTRSSKPWLISVSRKSVEEMPDCTGDEAWSPLDVMLLGEMLSFVKSGKGKLGAEPGKHDDLVVGDALAELARQEVPEEMLSEVMPDETETTAFLGKVAMHPKAEVYDPSAELGEEVGT